MQSNFTHLHVHSHYSLLDGLAKIDDLLKRAQELEMNSLALTDHGAMYGALEFYKKAKKAGIKPILGCELYVAYESRHQKRPNIDDKRYHLTVLAENLTGYKNLLKIVTKANLEGFYYKPRVDHDLLREHAKGLIVLSGCFQGEIQQAIRNKKLELAEKLARQYQEIFGKDNFFLEIMPLQEAFPEQKEIHEKLYELSRKTGARLVATNDIHYIKPEDAEAQDILVAVQTGSKVSDKDRLTMKGANLSMRSGQEMLDLLPTYKDAVERTAEIASRVNIDIPLGKWTFPNFAIPEGSSYDEELYKLASSGFVKRNLPENEEYKNRFAYEFKIIKQKGYAPYFLVVADLLRYAAENNILTNIRGSVAGSLVTYLTGITKIDPLKYELPFERFLNPERPSAPDIDMDFADNRRDEVIEYARQKYGADQVAQIGTFGTMMARAAVRDVARALGKPYAFGDRVAKLIPFGSQGFPMTIDQALKITPELREIYNMEPEVREVIDQSKKLEGCARHISVHAAGVVIAPKPLTEFVPLQFDPQGGKIITQYDMHAVEDAGLLKFDFLGIRNLSILEESMKLVKQHRGEEIDIENIPLDDKKTFALLARGETMGLFQLSGQGMTKYLKDLKPTTINDINAMVALYRPGPIESIPTYVQRKHNPALVKYFDPRMKEFLEQSYGLLVYQDDVLLTAIKMAGYSWLEADKLRKAMGKKIPKEMEAQKNKFIEGCVQNGLEMARAGELWKLIEPFAAYGFNKCLAGDTKIYDAISGKYFTVGELYRTNELPTIFSLSESQTIQKKNIYNVAQNGLKPIYEIITRRGLKIKATKTHRFLKFGGWVDLKNIKTGDRIATARKAPLPKKSYAIENYKLIVLGYLLAEGNLCHPHGIYFYSTRPEEIEDFISAAKKFKNSRIFVNESKPTIVVYVGKQDQKKPNDLRDWLNKLGLLDKLATKKFFPELVFQLNREQLSLLVAKMWQGDGCVHENDGFLSLYYATSSEKIAYNLQHLLLRLGIISTVHEKKFKYRKVLKFGWTVNISRYNNIKVFTETVGQYLIGEPKFVLNNGIKNHPIISGLIENYSARGSKDIVPAEILNIIKKEIYKNNPSLRSFAAENNLSPRLLWQDSAKVGYLRETLDRLATILKSKTLNKLANSDIYWDEVVSIKYAGKVMTYDLTIPDNHNFVANDIIVHNSHAASYGRVAYQTAYAKANFTTEFMTAILTAEAGDTEKTAEIISECRRLDIPVLSPDINESYDKFTAIKAGVKPGAADFCGTGDKIRFGLESIKNVGLNVIQAIVWARETSGKFQSITDFIERVQHKDLNKKSLESLIKCGAFDSLGERNQLLANLDLLLEYNRESQKNMRSGQSNLFGASAQIYTSSLRLKDAPAASKKEKLQWEKELLGLYVTEHPLEEFLEKLKNQKVMPLKNLNSDLRGRVVSIGGMINGIKKINTKGGEPMLFVEMEDLTAKTEVLVFPKVLARNQNVWQTQKILLVKGRVSDRDDTPKILCEEAIEVV